MQIQFDPTKAASNYKKHGVSFAEAEGVFYDPLAIHQPDPDSIDEERYVVIGMNNFDQLLVVIYTYRSDKIRIISARRATKREVKNYES